MSSVSITRTAGATALLLLSAFVAVAQKRGTITGTIKPPAPGVVVVVTDQVTSKVTRVRVGADGRARNFAGNLIGRDHYDAGRCPANCPRD